VKKFTDFLKRKKSQNEANSLNLN